MSEIYAGASGFAYPSWKPAFYPPALPQTRFLEHYATRLNSVEINYTFRRYPSPATIEKWLRQTPASFRFSLKAHQRITHFKRLREAGEATEFFFRSIEGLRAAGRLGAALFQLPPNMKKDLQRLEAYLEQLPQGVRCAFEFRHESWHDEAVYEALRRRNVCFCQAESEERTAPAVRTADFLYLRLRKREYSAEQRAALRARTLLALAGGATVFLYFKHEETPEGALYAEELLRRTQGG